MRYANRFTKYGILLALPALAMGLCWLGVWSRIPEASTPARLIKIVILVVHLVTPGIAFALDRERPGRLASVAAASVLLPEWALVSYSVWRPCPPGWSCEWSVFLLFAMALFTPAYVLYTAFVVAGCRALRARLIGRGDRATGKGGAGGVASDENAGNGGVAGGD